MEAEPDTVLLDPTVAEVEPREEALFDTVTDGELFGEPLPVLLELTLFELEMEPVSLLDELIVIVPSAVGVK